jgi:hypothetical protein
MDNLETDENPLMSGGEKKEEKLEQAAFKYHRAM